MRALLGFVVGAVLAVGCKGKSAPSCTSAVEGAVSRMMASMKSEMPVEAYGNVSKAAPRLTATMVSVCKEDAWSADVLGCYDTARDQPAITACEDKLTAAQKDKLQTRMMAALREAAPGAF